MLDKSPQRDQESLLLGVFEVVCYNTLTRLSEVAANGETQSVTYVIQNFDARLRIFVVQTRDKSSAFLIGQNPGQDLDGLGLVGRIGDVLP